MNYYNGMSQAGYFGGAVMLQDSGNIGGTRSVFVDLLGNKNELDAPSWGGQLQNPFPIPAKFYAGDLFELRYNEKGEDPKLFLLKTYEVKLMSTTTVKIYRDGFRHVPYVGEVLMKAPSTIGGKGKAYTIQSVKEAVDGGKDVWEVVFNTQLDECSDHDILVEAEAEGASGTMMVKTINTVAPSDGDFVYTPTTGASTKSAAAKMFYTPMMHGIMYTHRMSPMPKCVLALNKSRFNGWYEV